MRALCHFFLLSIVTKVRSVEEAKTTEVVSNAFVESSLTAEEKMTKKTVDELHTMAELKRDPRAMLPDSFTICSTVKTPSSIPYKNWSAFFTILVPVLSSHEEIELSFSQCHLCTRSKLHQMFLKYGSFGALSHWFDN